MPRFQVYGRPGLSPRVRGNLHRAPALGIADMRFRSIPASAGEPHGRKAADRSIPAMRHSVSEPVYPRECGGTCPRSGQRMGTQQANRGLSPRVRGNLEHPPVVDNQSSPHPVYPRECGGTPGLTVSSRRPLKVRSIPASAGEPRRWFLPNWQVGVYPRECGGTQTLTSLANPKNWVYPRECGGTDGIGYLALQSSLPVYPRECGGTSRRSRCRRLHPGLSPRVRGNRPGYSPWTP